MKELNTERERDGQRTGEKFDVGKDFQKEARESGADGIWGGESARERKGLTEFPNAFKREVKPSYSTRRRSPDSLGQDDCVRDRRGWEVMREVIRADGASKRRRRVGR